MSGSKTKEPWTTPEDLLERKQEADFLENYLKQASNTPASSHGRGSFVINLKGQWGTGKTYFLENFARQLRNSKHKVVEFDAWRADPDVDPLISLIAAIKKEIKPELKRGSQIGDLYGKVSKFAGTVAATFGKGLVKQGVKWAIGEAAEEIEHLLEEAEFFGLDKKKIKLALNTTEKEVKSGINTDNTEYKKTRIEIAAAANFATEVKSANTKREAIKAFSESFEKIAQAYANRDDCEGPFYIFVDELDRCRPTFAIEVLERINHLFDVKGVVFVIGTDSDELEHSIKAVYGSEFDSRSYLNRFFSFTYNLATPKTTNYIGYLVQLYDIDISKYSAWNTEVDTPETYVLAIEKILVKIVPNIRDYRHIFFMVKTFELNWSHKSNIDLNYAFACAAAVFYKKTYLITGNSNKWNEQRDKSFDHNWDSTRIDCNHSLREWVEIISNLKNITIFDKINELNRDFSNQSMRPVDNNMYKHLYTLLEAEKQASNGTDTSCLNKYIDYMRTASKISLDSPVSE